MKKFAGRRQPNFFKSGMVVEYIGDSMCGLEKGKKYIVEKSFTLSVRIAGNQYQWLPTRFKRVLD